MNKYFTNTSIGYLCVAAVIITALVSCGERSVSDEAVKAQTEACAKIGMKPYVRLTSGELLLDCRAPDPSPAGLLQPAK